MEMEMDFAKKQRLPFRNRDTIQNQMVSQSDMNVLQQCGSLLCFMYSLSSLLLPYLERIVNITSCGSDYH